MVRPAFKGPGLIRFRRDTRGATALEFAIIAPVFLAILFGIVEYSIFYFKRHYLNHLVFDSARVIQTGDIQEELNPWGSFLDNLCDESLVIYQCSEIFIDVRSFDTLAEATFTDPEFDEFGVPTNFVFEPGLSEQITAIQGASYHEFVTPHMRAFFQPNGEPLLFRAFYFVRNEPF